MAGTEVDPFGDTVPTTVGALWGGVGADATGAAAEADGASSTLAEMIGVVAT